MRCFLFSILKAALRPLVFDTYPEVIWLKGAILPTRPATTFRIQGYQNLSVHFQIWLNCTSTWNIWQQIHTSSTTHIHFCIQQFHIVKIVMDRPVAASSKMWKHLHVQLPPNGIMVRWNDTVWETTINFMGLRQLLPIIILREGVISRRLNITLVICRASSKLERGKFLANSKYVNTMIIFDKL